MKETVPLSPLMAHASNMGKHSGKLQGNTGRDTLETKGNGAELEFIFSPYGLQISNVPTVAFYCPTDVFSLYRNYTDKMKVQL